MRKEATRYQDAAIGATGGRRASKEAHFLDIGAHAIAWRQVHIDEEFTCRPVGIARDRLPEYLVDQFGIAKCWRRAASANGHVLDHREIIIRHGIPQEI